MKFTRRQFVKGGVSAFTVGFAAPQFLTDLALRAGGADAQSRRAVSRAAATTRSARSFRIATRRTTADGRRWRFPPAASLQIGTDSSGIELGLHPRLTGLKTIFDQGRLAIIQRTGYQNSSRSHFQGFDIWGTANPDNSQGTGWLGRYLDTLPSPIDPLVGWNTTRETPRPLMARTVGVPAITNPATYSFASPNSGTEAALERDCGDEDLVAPPGRSAAPGVRQFDGASRARHARPGREGRGLCADGDLSRTTASRQALRAVAGAMNKQIGTKVFWVQTGGFDTHSGQGANAGAYVNLMATVNDSVLAFYQDLSNQGLLELDAVIVFSEFGRRITENGSAGTDHGAAGIMMALGGTVRGGIYGTARRPAPGPGQPNAREQRRRREVRNRFPIGVRQGDRCVARRQLDRDPGRRLQSWSPGLPVDAVSFNCSASSKGPCQLRS